MGMKRGNIACHKSEARFGTLLREGRLASWASRDEAFWRSQVNFGPPNPATDEKALWSKGKRPDKIRYVTSDSIPSFKPEPERDASNAFSLEIGHGQYRLL
ncbi:unnamed protein product [Lupinus luteus]|uniref:Uncharacterized protein n=1 Tax=Lupinus luteus TaxID=3873 RepID=A0AAV1WKG0_LUPLU